MTKTIFSWAISARFVCVIFICGLPTGVYADQTKPQIVMACHVGPEENANGRFLKKVFTEAFNRLGYDLVYHYYPALRAGYLADQGRVDGELARLFDYNSEHPALIRVEESITTVRITAFTKDPAIKVHGWDSLAGTGYRVDYQRGSVYVMEQLNRRVSPGNLTAVAHEASGIKKLLAGNTDIYIHEESAVRQILASKTFRNELKEVFGLTAVYTAGVLDEKTVHTFLHKRHRALAKDLAAVLKEMKSEASWESYIQQRSRAGQIILERQPSQGQ